MNPNSRGPAGQNPGQDPTQEPSRGVSPAPAGAGPAEAMVERMLESLRQATSSVEMQRIAIWFLGDKCFTAGAAVGAGVDIIDSTVDLLKLLKTLVLADLHDFATGQVNWWRAVDLTFASRLATAKLAAIYFEEEMRQAGEERTALIAELTEALKDPKALFEGMVDSVVEEYKKDGNDFIAHTKANTLEGQFRAGMIFGKALVAILGLITGVAGAAKAVAKLGAKLPRLLKLAKGFKTKRPPKAPSSSAAGDAGGPSKPPTPAPKPKPPEPAPESAAPSAAPSGQQGGPKVHSRYADGTPVLEGQQPPRISGPDPNAQGPHTVLRHDTVNNRTYQGREFDANQNPVRDVDFTSPTYPNGRPRPDHLPPPHQHKWEVNDPKVGPRSGFKRGGGEPLE